MKKIKNFILCVSTMLVVSSQFGCSLQNESDYLNKRKIHFEKFMNDTKEDDKPIAMSHLMIKRESCPIFPTPTPSSIEENYSDNRPFVALTFDDGPSAYTEELIELLEQYDVKCTFFVVGDNCEKYSDALLSISNYSHEIAIHGDTHTSFTKLGSNKTEQEIMNTTQYIESLDINVSSLVRPPYGSLNNDIKNNVDFPFILWNIDTEDWKTRDKDSIKAEILDNIEPGSIILMHDTKAVHEVDMEVLNEILPNLVKEYHFVTVTELCEQYNLVLENGKVYRKVKSDK